MFVVFFLPPTSNPPEEKKTTIWLPGLEDQALLRGTSDLEIHDKK